MMLKLTTVVAVVFSLVACEDDYETIGTGIIGEPGFNASLYDDAEISVTNIDLAPVQTNNLPVYLLGVYNDNVFGKRTASILSQVSLTQANPNFGNLPVLDSVVLTVPYFSHEKEPDENGDKVYALDSVYGNAPIKLSVLETNYFLNSYDPETNFEQAQKYYSNMESAILNNLTPNVLYEKENFTPSSQEVVEFPVSERGVRDTVRLAPRMRLKLSEQFFQQKILDMQGTSELSSLSNFRNYFRSIYIKAESTGGQGNMMLLDLTQAEAKITMYYTSTITDKDDWDNDGDITESVDQYGSYSFLLGPGRVNIFDQEVPNFDNDKNIYLQGGEGSMAVIDLFSGPDADSDGVSDELEFLRDNNWLINEANLEFYVNQNYTSGLREPARIYLYDLTNYTLLSDYVLDAQGQLNEPASTSNLDHLVPLTKDENGRGEMYKVKLTRHINNILNKGTKNVKLGLVVTGNVNLVANSAVLQTESTEVKRVPVGSLVTPKGTVLYGPNAENEDKRLKLRIYYTEPKN